MAHTPSEAAPDAPDATLHEPARRDFLYLVTGSVAAVGAAVTLWPFIDQMNPDAATIAAAGPVDIDISQVQEGQRMVTLWAARPVFIVHRPASALKELQRPEALEPASRSQFGQLAAAGIRQELAPLDQAGIPRRRRHLHPSRLRPALRAQSQ